MRILRVILIFCIFTSVVELSALEEASVIQFRTLSWEGAIRDIYFLNGDERVDAIIPDGAPSERYECRTDGLITFYRDGPIGEGGLPTPVVVATVSLPLSIRDPLLLFFKLQVEGRVTYRIMPVSRNGASDMSDYYQLFNLSNHDLAAKLDTKELKLKRGNHLVVDAPKLDGPNFGVMMALEVEGGETGDWELVYRSFWPYRSGRSCIVFITDRKGQAGAIDVRRYYMSN